MSTTLRYAATSIRSDVTLAGSQTIASATISKSWGLQPATANLVYVEEFTTPASGALASAPPVVLGSFAKIEIGTAHSFWGVVKGVHAEDSSGGRTVTVQWADHREFLQYDVVFGQFNIIDNYTSLVSGVPTRLRRWKHMLPADVSAQTWTYSNAPLTAADILDYLFGAPTVESSWVRQYHAAMSSVAVYSLDFSAGIHLGNAVQSVGDRIGMVFTLVDSFTLRWRRKGELVTTGSHPDSNMPWSASPFPTSGGLFVFPTSGGNPSADNCRDGTAVSGQATRVLISGDRNRYQVVNLTLDADWPVGWNAFWDESILLKWVYDNLSDPALAEPYNAITGDTEHIIGWQLATARAQRMTVREFADARQAVSGDGANFIDYRKFSGMGRFDMPAVLYLKAVVWRAYRLPTTVLSRNNRAWRLESRALCSVTFDAAGVMTADPTIPVDGAGTAIVQGWGFNSADSFKALNPDRFVLSDWVATNSAWTNMAFQVDPDGGDGIGFIVLDAPALSAADAYVDVTSGSRTYVVPNADPTFTPATVKASLTLAGERYERLYPSSAPAQQRDDSIHEPALFLETVVNYDGTPIGQIDYADATTPDDKADELGVAYIRSWYFREGGFTRFFDPTTEGGVQINGLIDRVTVSVSSSGVQEEVDFTVERSSPAFEPERNYERRLLAEDMFPGQRELRQSADIATALARSLRQNPGLLVTLSKAFADNLGYGNTAPGKVAGSATLDFGTPLWRPATASIATDPASTSSTDTILHGITSRDAEAAGGPLQLVQSGRALVRVDGGAGGVAIGDSLGRKDGATALHGVASGGVAIARDAVPASATHLIWADVAPVSSGGGSYVSGRMEAPAVEVYIIVVKAPTGGSIAGIDYSVVTGSVTFDVTVNGSAVSGGSGLTIASSTPATTNFTGVTYASGDLIAISITAVSTPGPFDFVLRFA